MNIFAKVSSTPALAFFYSIALISVIYSSQAQTDNDEYKHEFIKENRNTDVAQVAFKNLYNLPNNVEIHYGYPSSTYDEMTHVIGSLGSNRTLSLPYGTRVIVSMAPFLELWCYYFDVVGTGKTKIDFFSTFWNVHFRIANTNIIKPVFGSDFGYIESDDYYKCPWPSPN